MSGSRNVIRDSQEKGNGVKSPVLPMEEHGSSHLKSQCIWS